MAVETFQVKTQLKEGFEVQVNARDFTLTVDEPRELGGTDKGANPIEYLLAASGACLSIVARIYAPQFDIDLHDLQITVEGDLDLDGFLDKADVPVGVSELRVNVDIKSDAPAERVAEFIQFVNQHCPIGQTVANPLKVLLNGEITSDPAAYAKESVAA